MVGPSMPQLSLNPLLSNSSCASAACSVDPRRNKLRTSAAPAKFNPFVHTKTLFQLLQPPRLPVLDYENDGTDDVHWLDAGANNKKRVPEGSHPNGYAEVDDIGMRFVSASSAAEKDYALNTSSNSSLPVSPDPLRQDFDILLQHIKPHAAHIQQAIESSAHIPCLAKLYQKLQRAWNFIECRDETAIEDKTQSTSSLLVFLDTLLDCCLPIEQAVAPTIMVKQTAETSLLHSQLADAIEHLSINTRSLCEEASLHEKAWNARIDTLEAEKRRLSENLDATTCALAKSILQNQVAMAVHTGQLKQAFTRRVDQHLQKSKKPCQPQCTEPPDTSTSCDECQEQQHVETDSKTAAEIDMLHDKVESIEQQQIMPVGMEHIKTAMNETALLLSTTETKIEALQDRIDYVNANIELLTGDHHRLGQQLTNEAKQNHQLAQELSESQRTNAEMEERLNMMNNELISVKRLLETECCSLKSQTAESEERCLTWKQSSEKYKLELSLEKQHICQAELEMVRLQVMLNEQKEEVQKTKQVLETEIEHNSKQLLQLETIHAELQSSVAKSDVKARDLDHQLLIAREQLEEKVVALKKMELTLYDESSQILAVKEELKMLTTHKMQLMQNLRDQQQQCTQLSANHQIFQQSLRTKDDIILSLVQENEKKNSIISAFEARSAIAESQAIQAEAELKHIQNQLLDSKNQKLALHLRNEQELDSLRLALQSMADDLCKCRRDRDLAVQHVQQAAEQDQDYERQVTEWKGQVYRLEREMEKAQQDMAMLLLLSDEHVRTTQGWLAAEEQRLQEVENIKRLAKVGDKRLIEEETKRAACEYTLKCVHKNCIHMERRIKTLTEQLQSEKSQALTFKQMEHDQQEQIRRCNSEIKTLVHIREEQNKKLELLANVQHRVHILEEEVMKSKNNEEKWKNQANEEKIKREDIECSRKECKTLVIALEEELTHSTTRMTSLSGEMSSVIASLRAELLSVRMREQESISAIESLQQGKEDASRLQCATRKQLDDAEVFTRDLQKKLLSLQADHDVGQVAWSATKLQSEQNQQELCRLNRLCQIQEAEIASGKEECDKFRQSNERLTKALNKTENHLQALTTAVSNQAHLNGLTCRTKERSSVSTSAILESDVEQLKKQNKILQQHVHRLQSSLQGRQACARDHDVNAKLLARDIANSLRQQLAAERAKNAVVYQ